MFSHGDVFRCSGGRCVFVSRGKTPDSINNEVSFERPHIHVKYVVVCVMADKFSELLGCVTESVVSSTGFEYHFRRRADTMTFQSAPTEIILHLGEIRSWLDASRDQNNRLSHIDEYINDDGRLAFAWMLTALFGVQYYASSSEVRVAWSTSTERRLTGMDIQ